MSILIERAIVAAFNKLARPARAMTCIVCHLGQRFPSFYEGARRSHARPPQVRLREGDGVTTISQFTERSRRPEWGRLNGALP